MKQFLIKILNSYLYIGAFFAIINQLSWLYSSFATIYHQFSAVFSWNGIMSYGTSLIIRLTWEPALRLILWLPSLLSLLNPDISISFMQWLAPGFYELLFYVEK